METMVETSTKVPRKEEDEEEEDEDASILNAWNAANRAVDLIEELGQVDPYDGNISDNPWRNPQEIWNQLKKAKKEVLDAMPVIPESNTREWKETNMRAAYLDMITDAFGNVLNDLRQEEEEELDVNVLVDCLQSGFDLLSTDEKELFYFTTMQDDEDDDDLLTPHEKQQRDLGFHVQVPS